MDMIACTAHDSLLVRTRRQQLRRTLWALSIDYIDHSMRSDTTNQRPIQEHPNAVGINGMTGALYPRKHGQYIEEKMTVQYHHLMCVEGQSAF